MKRFGTEQTVRKQENKLSKAEDQKDRKSDYKKSAFTLAEVLITLGIIGVVAALTMPSLIQHHKKVETSARLKKFYSMMNQAIMLSETDNGPRSTWIQDDYLDKKGNILSNENRKNSVKTYFNTYIKDYIKYTKIDENPDVNVDEDGVSRYIHIYLPDSSYIRMQNGDCIDFDIDTNGTNKPNQYGKDIFKFILCSNRIRNNATRYCDDNFNPYGGIRWCDKTRTELRDKCKESAEYCAVLLMLDGWEFKDDYPYKL